MSVELLAVPVHIRIRSATTTLKLASNILTKCMYDLCGETNGKLIVHFKSLHSVGNEFVSNERVLVLNTYKM